MIRLDRDGARWTVTLNRPDKANALTAEMLGQIAEIASDAQGKAQVLVLTGQGKVFSAGADLDGMQAGLGLDPVWETASSALAALDAVTIAALNGTLAGGAFGIALACDLRVCVGGARFFYPVMKLGFRPQPSDPARLAALVGPARARLILLAAQRLEATEALQIGLVDRVVEDQAALAAAVEALAEAPLAAQPDHVATLKAMTRT